jgi:hypothetical protein
VISGFRCRGSSAGRGLKIISEREAANLIILSASSKIVIS